MVRHNNSAEKSLYEPLQNGKIQFIQSKNMTVRGMAYNIVYNKRNSKFMGESFQDYSWMQYLEADFPYRKSASLWDALALGLRCNLARPLWYTH